MLERASRHKGKVYKRCGLLGRHDRRRNGALERSVCTDLLTIAVKEILEDKEEFIQ